MDKKKLIKLALSGAMLLFVLQFVDGRKLKEAIQTIPLWLAAAILVCYSLGQVVSAYKWLLLLRAAGLVVSFPRVLTAYFIGMYVNCFGLGTLGGDLVRGVLVAEQNNQRHISLASVVADRALGLAVLASIGLIAAFFYGHDAVRKEFIYLGIGFVAVVIFIWLLAPKTATLLLSKKPLLQSKINDMLLAFPKNPLMLIWISAISAIFHLSQIGLHSLIAYGVGASIPFAYLCVAVPFANIISTLPISWMGLGVRENLYFLFFVPMYLSQEQAIVFGALWIFGMTLAAAIGGIFAVITGDIKVIATRRATSSEV